MNSFVIEDLGFFVPEKIIKNLMKKEEKEMAKIRQDAKSTTLLMDLGNGKEIEISGTFVDERSISPYADESGMEYFLENFSADFVRKEYFRPTRVIFNDTDTTCYFGEDKVSVALLPGDTYDREKGLLFCIAKYVLGSYTNFQKLIEGAEYYSNKKKNNKEKEIPRGETVVKVNLPW